MTDDRWSHYIAIVIVKTATILVTEVDIPVIVSIISTSLPFYSTS